VTGTSILTIRPAGGAKRFVAKTNSKLLTLSTQLDGLLRAVVAIAVWPTFLPLVFALLVLF